MHRKLKSIAICGKATIDKWLEISPSWTKSNVRLGSIASVRQRARRVRSTSRSGPAGRPPAHPRLSRLRRVDDLGDGSASWCVATAMAPSLLKALAFPSEPPAGRRDRMENSSIQPTTCARPTAALLSCRPLLGWPPPPCLTVGHAKTPDNLRNSPLRRSGGNRPSACSVAVGGRALRASDLCKSSASASLVEALADGLSNCRRFAAKSALDQPR